MPHTHHAAGFAGLHLLPPILKAIHEEGYTVPTPIQAQAIPIVLKGHDLLGCAQTGTGKTAAFAIPILQQLLHEPAQDRHKHIRALIVTPTRELAIQIKESFDAYGRHTGLRYAVIFGGVGQGQQTTTLKSGVDILIATPGRLLDLMGQGFISLQHIRHFVLDEADRMLDMGFIRDIRKIIQALPHKRQSLFFSATMPPEIVTLSRTILHNPESVTVTPVSSTVEMISQFVMHVDKGNKGALLLHVLKDHAVSSVLVFTRTKHGADKVVRMLVKNNIKAEAIHGNKAQNARQRALSNFKSQSTRVLVATDIASRGIDVDDMEWVINYEIPNIPETYVHRIGRTGRAGAQGTAYSFCDAEEKAFLKDIEKLIGKKIPVIDDHPYPFTGKSTAAPADQSQPRASRTPAARGHHQPQGQRQPSGERQHSGQRQPSGPRQHSGQLSEQRQQSGQRNQRSAPQSHRSKETTRTTEPRTTASSKQKEERNHRDRSSAPGQQSSPTSRNRSRQRTRSRSTESGRTERSPGKESAAGTPKKESWFSRFNFLRRKK